MATLNLSVVHFGDFSGFLLYESTRALGIHESLWADASRSVAKMIAMYNLMEKKTSPTLQGIYHSICALDFNEPDPDEVSITAIIDEFANLPKMPSIAKGVSFLRSYRIRVCAFVQHIMI